MKDSPTPPNPYATGAAQTQSNLATSSAQQRLNMVDQSNPYGSLKYTETGTNPDGTPKFSADTTLAPAQQQLLDQSNANKSAAGGLAGQFLAGGQGAFSGKGPDLSYNGTTAALDDLNHKRLDPQWADNTRHQEDTLAARGIVPGTPAYDNAMRVFNQGKNDAYNSANLADYDLSSRNALSQWNAPMGAYLGLTGASQPTNFSAMNTPNANVAGTNIAGLVEDNYKQESANANAQNGQLAGLAGTALAVGAAPFTGGMSLGALPATMGGMFGSSGGSNWGANNPGVNGSAYYGPAR